MTARLTVKMRWTLALTVAIFAPAIGQVSAPLSDPRLERLALVDSLLPQRLNRVIYDDTSMRAEIKRIGFARGCRVLQESRREVSAAFAPKLVPATVAAIYRIVPNERLKEMRIVSFSSVPLLIYRSRIDAELAVTAQPILSQAYDAMRRSFTVGTKAIPDTTDPVANDIMPKADVAAAVRIRRHYNLDDPAQLGMACAELLISPLSRPTIRTTPPVQYEVMVPEPFRQPHDMPQPTQPTGPQ